MYQGKSFLALIPARSGSKGLPGKNLMLLDGKPLVSYPINAALKSKYTDKVVLSSDDHKIMDAARAFNCEIPFKRPEELASDTASSIDVVLHAINYYEEHGIFFDYLVLLEPTSPLTESADVDKAIESLIANQASADSIVGVSQVESNHPMFIAKIDDNGTLAPYARKDFLTPVRRQELEELVFFEGSLYISEIKKLKETKSFVHERTLPYLVPRWKSIEIDEYSDFLIADIFYKQYIKKEK